ncbi:MAG: lysophospholipid acyltransferase family protein [Clostridia bacterium]|nr:lysophospholipid acyltransferase family protein [Clostridia bacterium]
MPQNQPSSHAVRGFLTIGTLYSYLYCMLASNVMLSMPILGGALYLAGQTIILIFSLRRPVQEGIVSKLMQRMGTVLLLILFVLLLLLMTVYPIRLDSADFWRLAGIVLCIVLRPGITRYAVERAVLARKKTMQILLRIAGVQLLFLPLLLMMLLLSPLDRLTVWALLGGYLLSGILESFPLERMQEHLRPYTEEDKQEIQALRGVHAYRMFQNMMLVVAAALQITQVMSYTYIAVTADALIVCMTIALLCTYAASLLTDALMRRRRIREQDPNFLLMAGLAIWLYGIVLFTRSLDLPGSVNGYLALALCTGGATVCVRILVWLEEDMRRVAAFGIGHAPGGAMDMAQQVRISFSSLLGQMVALAGLTLINIFTATDFPNDWDVAFRSFSPLLTLPALILVGVAILFALRFPLTRQHLEKLHKYMDLQQEGQENVPLHDQLEAVVVKKSLKRYGIKAILFILRPLYRHKIIGKENVQLDPDTPCVFVCNHGEIYGPVVATLYVPFSFRPWVAYEITDVNAIAERTMNGTFQNVKGFWRRPLNWIMIKIGAPFLAWVMKSVDCIPVYHDNPRKLMQTFRDTVSAMQAGDNILLFPENADTSVDHRYVREGVSEFFTGFTMIGQLYNNKTGKCPLFVPVYANKRKRTITFGAPTRYNPDIPANEEKERLCDYLRGEMLKIAGTEQQEK